MSSILRRRNKTSAHLQLKSPGMNTRVYTSIHVTYNVTGVGIDPKAVERAIELSKRSIARDAMLKTCGNYSHDQHCQRSRY